MVGDHSNSPFLRYTLSMAYSTTIGDWIDYSGMQPLDDFLLHNLLHRRIQASLVLNTRLMIRHELDFMRENTRRDPNNVRNGPPNSSSEPF